MAKQYLRRIAKSPYCVIYSIVAPEIRDAALCRYAGPSKNTILPDSAIALRSLSAFNIIYGSVLQPFYKSILHNNTIIKNSHHLPEIIYVT